jgi:hypothetical protein
MSGIDWGKAPEGAKYAGIASELAAPLPHASNQAWGKL